MFVRFDDLTISHSAGAPGKYIVASGVIILKIGHQYIIGTDEIHQILPYDITLNVNGIKAIIGLEIFMQESDQEPSMVIDTSHITHIRLNPFKAASYTVEKFLRWRRYLISAEFLFIDGPNKKNEMLAYNFYVSINPDYGKEEGGKHE